MSQVITAEGRSDVSVSDAFAYVADYRTTPEWFFKMSSFVPVSEVTYGLGSEFQAKLAIGPGIKTRIRCVEFVENQVFTMESLDGIRNRSRWEFVEDDGGTLLRGELTFDLPGGIAGAALGRVIKPLIAVGVQQTTDNLVRRAGR